MAKEYKLDLFKQTLPALYNGDLNFYERLTDEEKKEISPRVLMRWISGTENAHPILLQFLNDNMNRHVDLLKNHPDLLWKLLATIASEFKTGSRVPRTTWYKLPKGKVSSATPFLDGLLMKNQPLLNNAEVRLLKRRITPDDIKALISEFGLSDSEIKTLKEEYKNGCN